MPEIGDLEGVNEPVITLSAEIDWDDEAEVVVVGSGIAGCSAAINCAVQGASVLMLEKSDSTGGTSAKSGAGALVPNNRFLRQAGRETESKADFIGLLARLGRPALYDTSHPTFGLPQWEYDLIETYYDNAEEAWSYMEDIDAVKVMHFPDWPSYNDIPEEKYPFGRMIFPCDDDGQLAFGREAIDRLVRKATALGAKLLTGFGVTGVYVNQVGEIVGVRGFSDGEVRSVRALRSVVFSTGGFTHSSQYAREYLNGQIVGGCAARTNTGDFIPIAKAMGAPLFQMNSAFLAPLVYEQAIDKDPDLVTNFNFAGDSGLVVNKYGVRVGNEKAQYNDRTQSHYVWDAHRAEYPNFLQFGIIDQRTRENFGYSGRGDYQAGNFIPSPGESSKYLIEAETIPDLVRMFREKLNELSDHHGGVELAADFEDRLVQTIARFNEFARSGVDADFHRGDSRLEKWLAELDASWGTDDTTASVGIETLPNKCLYPMSETGPFYGVILAPGSLDTKGGPKVNQRSQVLDGEENPIPGLYGIGNCVAHPSGVSYWSGGSSWGPYLTFGYVAARSIVNEPVKAVEANTVAGA